MTHGLSSSALPCDTSGERNIPFVNNIVKNDALFSKVFFCHFIANFCRERKNRTRFYADCTKEREQIVVMEGCPKATAADQADLFNKMVQII